VKTNENLILRSWNRKTSRQVVEDAINASKVRDQTWWQVIANLRKEPTDETD
jgi:hypothetical protein